MGTKGRVDAFGVATRPLCSAPSFLTTELHRFVETLRVPLLLYDIPDFRTYIHPVSIFSNSSVLHSLKPMFPTVRGYWWAPLIELIPFDICLFVFSSKRPRWPEFWYPSTSFLFLNENVPLWFQNFQPFLLYIEWERIIFRICFCRTFFSFSVIFSYYELRLV